MTDLVNKIGVRTQERRLAMNDFGQFEQTDEVMLICDVPDEAIENAAGSVMENAGAFTLSFCSGLDTCPT
jgi:hypothetical protein